MNVAQRLYFGERLGGRGQAVVSSDVVPAEFGAPMEFNAEVTDIREDSRRDARQLWQLALDRTAFYPAGGGQPWDLGCLKAVARSGASLEIPVLRVEEDDSGEVWHWVEKPLAAGTRITGYVDQSRRRDHAQQHTGQHLLSAIMLRELRVPTISFHLGERSSTIDLGGLDLDTFPEDTLERVETAVNQAIAADLPVRTSWVERPEAELLLARGDLRKLPERSGPIRLVEIQGVEFNACGGTHVCSTGQIGGLTLRGSERVRGALRVEFCCGLRAIRTARGDLNALTEAGRTLSAGLRDVPARVTRLLQELRAASKQREALLEELAEMEARLVVGGAGGPEGAGLIEVLAVERDVTYAKLLAGKIVAEASAAVVIVAATNPVRATLVLARGSRVVLDCAQVMRSAMAAAGARGGGSAEIAQGAIDLELLQETVAALRSLSGF